MVWSLPRDEPPNPERTISGVLEKILKQYRGTFSQLRYRPGLPR